MSEVEIHGLSETLDAMKKLDADVQKKIVPKGLRVGAKLVQAAAVAEAPAKSGLTRQNIKISSSSRQGRSRVSIGLKDKDFTGQTFYAAFLIYGHKAGPRELGDARRNVPADNFLNRAVTRTGEAAIAAAAASWAEQINAQTKGA